MKEIALFTMFASGLAFILFLFTGHHTNMSWALLVFYLSFMVGVLLDEE